MTVQAGFSRDHADDDYCYLLVTGRRSGVKRRIEIWFAIENGVLYVLAGGGEATQWVKNLRVKPGLEIELGGYEQAALARDVESPEEDALARRLLVEKYQARYAGDLTNWGQTALPMAFEVETDRARKAQP